MGTYKKGILGGFTGTVGSVVGAKWRGKYVMRSLPDRGDYVSTPSQLEQQAKFTKVIKFLTPMKMIVGKYFGQPSGTKSKFNLASSYHLKYALVDVAGEPEMDFSKVIISKGDLQGLMDGEMVALANQELKISWINNSAMGFAHDNDPLLLVVYAEALNLYSVQVAVATRADESYVLQLPAYLSGIEVQAWASFATANGKEAATSMYLGSEVVS